MFASTAVQQFNSIIWPMYVGFEPAAPKDVRKHHFHPLADSNSALACLLTDTKLLLGFSVKNTRLPTSLTAYVFCVTWPVSWHLCRHQLSAAFIWGCKATGCAVPSSRSYYILSTHHVIGEPETGWWSLLYARKLLLVSSRTEIITGKGKKGEKRVNLSRVFTFFYTNIHHTAVVV